MARDHARIRLDIWDDDDFRDLPSSSQWLYFHLCSSKSLSFCGVTDWRPARIGAHTAELTGDDIECFAADLEAGQFVIVDRDSEEALVRSFIRHDGLMKEPNMAKAMVKDHAVIGSRVLRAVVIDQLKRYKRQEPHLRGWAHTGTLLQKRSMTPAQAFAVLLPNPSGKPSVTPSGKPSEKGGPHPSATPSLPNSLTPFLPNSAKSKTPKSPHHGDDLGLESA